MPTTERFKDLSRAWHQKKNSSQLEKCMRSLQQTIDSEQNFQLVRMLVNSLELAASQGLCRLSPTHCAGGLQIGRAQSPLHKRQQGACQDLRRVPQSHSKGSHITSSAGMFAREADPAGGLYFALQISETSDRSRHNIAFQN